MFRIYRDLRFSKDKTPYKTYLAARFPHIESKGCSAPGFYLSIQADGGYGASGVWHPDSGTLKRIRESIARQPDQWKKISKKMPIEGERLKNPPRGFDPHHPLVEDLKLKDFVTSVRFSANEIGSHDFLERFTRACRRMTPLVRYLCRVLKLKF